MPKLCEKLEESKNVMQEIANCHILISHKLQDATRKPEALHLPHPSS